MIKPEKRKSRVCITLAVVLLLLIGSLAAFFVYQDTSVRRSVGLAARVAFHGSIAELCSYIDFGIYLNKFGTLRAWDPIKKLRTLDGVVTAHEKKERYRISTR
ncbi:MAG: hypothetical protein GKR87_08110 [Kiritimatiellae bacterium]|nr:hypothetical protein [Kiritimatiellia bacterium]